MSRGPTRDCPRRGFVIAFTLMMIVACGADFAAGQGSRGDYERSRNLDERTRDTVFRASVEPNWLPEGRAFWYRVATGPGRAEFVFVDAESGDRRPAFDHARLAEALGEASGEAVEADRLPFRAFRPEADLAAITFAAFGKRWRCDLETYAVEDVGAADDAEDALRARAVPYATRRNGPETSLRFVNRTDAEARLFWIDADGGRRPYGSIAAGRDREQHTYAGHVWLVADERERVLGVFEAVEEPSTAVITGERPRGVEPEQGRGQAPRRRRPERARPDGTSPDGAWRASIRDHNVVVVNTESGETFELSMDGRPENAYQGRFFWSPDSSKLVAMRVEPGEGRQIHLIDSAPDDQLQPKLITIDYAKPGDRIDHPRPRLFDIASRQCLSIDDALFPDPWSLTELAWSPDSGSFSFLYNQRGHQVLRLVEVDASTGDTRTVLEETSPTFLDYAHKTYLRRLDATGEILWMSERDGWNHLYLIDAASGEVKNRVTQGEWVVRGVERVDEEARRVWLRVLGIHPDQDPYHEHLARVDFDGSGLVVLTEGDGTHRWEFSPDRRFLIDTYSRVDMPPVTELRRTEDGSLVCELERADGSALLATGWIPPERFVAKGRDGVTDIYGIIVRPSNFDPGRRYPVVEQIYAGPQGAFVPKAFDRMIGLGRLAELGFVVVQIDGMGTNWRSKAFHDVCWRNLADAGFPDRIAWLKAAAEAHPELDLERVGIYGGSAGGQNALGALLFHPEFYKAAVADCGCHDNHMDKIWWNELWMGYPIGDHYAASSNVTNAHKLQGKLLLIVGELDRNVDPASTMQVVDALVKADKDFDLLVVPGAGHGAGGSPYGTRRRMDFFVRHLLGVEPRHEED